MKGQALPEFIFSMGLLVLVITGSLKIFRNSYLSLQCHIHAFERGRSILNSQAREESITEIKSCENGKTVSLEFKPLEELFGRPTG